MSLLLSLPLFPLSAAVFALVLAVVLRASRGPSSNDPMARLTHYTSYASSPGLAVQTRTARQRLLDPLIARLLSYAASTAPKRVRRAAAAELVMAGSSMSPTVFLGIRGVLTFGLPAVALLVVLSSSERSAVQWGVLVAAVFLGRRLPSMWLRRHSRARQRAIERSLPYALDLLVACIEGGLSLDGALAKVAEQSSGTLALELRRSLQEMMLGRSTADALHDLGERTGSAELKRLTDNVIQADRMGISLAQTLRTLAEDSRLRRRQLAEETARKAPIKMMPVIICFILPAVAGVLLTPAAINIGRTLSQFHR